MPFLNEKEARQRLELTEKEAAEKQKRQQIELLAGEKNQRIGIGKDSFFKRFAYGMGAALLAIYWFDSYWIFIFKEKPISNLKAQRLKSNNRRISFLKKE
ncbi:MAG: hypothetical protein R2784_02885 [Saprospiraceae bacterium]